MHPDHGGPVTTHKGKPLFACYEHGRCVAVGTAQEVADAVGVKESAVLCGVTPSRGGRHARRQYFRFYERSENDEEKGDVVSTDGWEDR